MSDAEAADRLLVQQRNFGTFALLRGVSPFYFARRLGLLLPGVSCIRIFDYTGPATNEVGLVVNDRMRIQNCDGKEYLPRDLLALNKAESGWEINFLKPGSEEVLEKWLEENSEVNQSDG